MSVNDDTGCLSVRYADEGKRGIVDHALTVDYVQAKQTSSAPLSPPRSSSEGAGASHPASHQQQVRVAASPTAYLRAMEAERLSTAGQLKAAAPRAAAGSSSPQGQLRRGGGGATPAPDLPPALSALEERLSEVFHGSSLDGEQEDRFWEAETAVAERRLRLSAAARKKLGAARKLSGATTGNESRFAKALLQSGGHNSALF
eukprot:COSAG01_NODE_349_length_18469_cov_8.136364_3_plen_202_part_00